MKRIVALILCLTASCLALMGCSDTSEVFTPRTYTVPSAEVDQIRIGGRDRQIEVTVSGDDQIHVDCSESSKEAYAITLLGSTLSMTARASKEWTDYIGVKPAAGFRRISLAVPEQALGSLSLTTTNGDIVLQPLAAGSVALSSNGGNISFDMLAVGQTLTLAVKNGDVKGTVAGAYEEFAIQVESKKGNSNLPESKPGGRKTLDVTCNNGDIDVEFVPA